MDTERPPFDGPEQPVPVKREDARLTATEARLLEVLRTQPGRVFTRSESTSKRCGGNLAAWVG